MNIEEQFDLWESELSFRERSEMALDFIESQTTAYGIIIKEAQTEGADTALIYYDLQTEFREYLRNIFEESEMEREDDEPWVNYDVDAFVDDPHFQ